ncbi:hypothetical protein DOM21_09050 [Bacteriovorax stolpii]|uniref:Uncharacterized protein n=1 Tax=Bacteriovorax stolpii TaxID=960 RepID=A0A2K9NUI7_BACTC|nr:hypothetical protein [Bacteriovorax stolpii]AUN98424.1 hypothetical protein C0V70_09965 [Bacteriovorax stolpii]QDK41596.1 hypothetical protein DOM21_09050 [Bacteriovorax stolpii]TDP50953.1 hypothetical protein C8D79_3692 [Bacteriovorax stolpii]
MKTILGKCFLAFALILMGASVCFPNDLDCSKEHSSATVSKEQPIKNAQNKKDQQKEHHCICSLSCHNLFVQKLDAKTLSAHFIIRPIALVYVPSFYPKIILSLEKPPTV